MASNLPPGVTQGMIDAFFAEGPCMVCGRGEDDCVCPECPVCQDVGNPQCYDEINNQRTQPGHGLKLSWDQKIGRAERDLERLEDQVVSQQQFIDWLKGEKEREEENKPPA